MLIPDSTYRVQLHAGFTFSQLESILEYLHELGISTIYASPITKAIKGENDPNTILFLTSIRTLREN